MAGKNRGKASGYLRVSGLVIIVFSIIGMPFIVYGQEAQTQLPAEESSAPGARKTVEIAPGNVSIDFKNADIQNVLRILSLKSGVNIVAGDEVIGKVTIRLTDVPWEKALQIVLRTYGFTYEKDDNVIRVTTVESMKMEALVTEIFVLNFCIAEDVNLSIQPMLTERGSTSIDVRTNSILVTDTPQSLDTVEMIIKRLDRITPQVMIEAKMIETTLDDNENLGIDWTLGGEVSGSSRKVTFPFDKSKGGTRLFPGESLPQNDPSDALFPGGNPTEFPMVAASDFAFGTLDFTAMKLVMEILKSRTNTKILSSPRIVTMDNQEAEIIVATIWPFPTYEVSEGTGNLIVSGFSKERIGIILTVTPTINQRDYITMKVHPKVSELTTTTTSEGQPVTLTREAKTRVIIKDGHTIAIGGLIKEKTVDVVVKVPILGDIPILGYLFKKKDKAVDTTDLLIFITPRIIRDQSIQDKVIIQTAVPAVFQSPVASTAQPVIPLKEQPPVLSTPPITDLKEETAFQE